jgi:hypothetical protein
MVIAPVPEAATSIAGCGALGFVLLALGIRSKRSV